MKVFRLKHIQSGLYYQPVNGYIKSNLSKGGKLYHTKSNPFSSKGEDYIYIHVDKRAKVFESIKELFPLNSDGNISTKVSKEQFKIEEIK